MSSRRKIIKIVGWSLAAIPLLMLVYFLSALLLSHVTVNNGFKQTPDGVTIYVKSNGVHTDIIVPAKNELIDWATKIKPDDFKQGKLNYLAFGWGDKGFYLNTPTWADLKFSTAFKALFWLSSSAMHVTYYSDAPVINTQVRQLKISPQQYQQLCEYIDNSFQKDTMHDNMLIYGHHYDGVNDNFYEAKGVYSLFQTCNGWANGALKKTGVRTCIWTPFDWGILNNLEEE